MKATYRLLRFLLALILLQPLVEVALIAAPGMTGGSIAALARSYGSGGYSRPGGGSHGFSAPVRRPSTSGGGGYYRPPAMGAPGTSGFSGGDRAISRQQSGEAFRNYQSSRQPPAAVERRPSPWGADNGSAYAPPARRPPPAGWATGPRYAPPYAAGQRRFGAWDALLLYGLLNSLNGPGRTSFFHDNQNDPGYRAWREDADRRARNDPALAAQLSDLDKRLAEDKDQPRNPGSPPPPLASPVSSDGGSGVVIPVVILGLIAFAGLWYMRRRASAAARTAAPPGLAGSRESRFRVGMTIPVDPAPFVLAAGATKVTPPEGSGMISVEAVGLLSDGAVALHRLYLPGRRSLFQLHLGGAGTPDECRYFSQIDEVTPASQEEWGFWLDRAQGLIGWPQFQTKDGKTYGRVWAPGGARIEPRQQTETVQDVQGTTNRTVMAMLYGGPTGAAPPAPDTEYILVSAINDGGQAWVEIHAGIDVNPAALTLPSVPFAS
ncbi:MAG TPA: DUF2491 family protein [Acetobacteraceae bacterium]|nr:DUF2491 family protein [Acetobacteraceae bacterium]